MLPPDELNLIAIIINKQQQNNKNIQKSLNPQLNGRPLKVTTQFRSGFPFQSHSKADHMES